MKIKSNQVTASSQMSLVKYCKSAHATDAIEKGKIFVGTFALYKSIENEALRDLDEGSATPAILDEEADMLLSENDNDSLLKHSPFKLANGWKIELPKNMQLWLEQSAFNTFVYCVSNDREPSIEKANRLGYDSYFKISDPVNFGRALMQSLSIHLNSKFGIKGDVSAVSYVSRKIQIVNRETPTRPAKSLSTQDFFIKHERFSDDIEVRYVFSEYSDDAHTQFNSLDIEGNGVIIENPEIAKWIVLG